jgi:hypothetical protein
MSKVTNKAYASIAIKPVVPEYREAIRQLISHKLPDGYTYDVKNAGTTTIEINKAGVDKCFAVEKHLNETDTEYNTVSSVRPIKVVYLGDEGFGGNDECIRQMSLVDNRIKFLPVKNPRDTAIYLTTLAKCSISGFPLITSQFEKSASE